jgi:hypothetical protein
MTFIKENLKEISNPKKITDIVVFQKGNNFPQRIKTSNFGEGNYKSYVALISQEGESNPTVEILHNTIGDIVWTRIGVGTYLGTLNGAFPVSKTFTFCQNSRAGTDFSILYTLSRNTDNTVEFDSYSSPGNGADEASYYVSIEIRVYF